MKSCFATPHPSCHFQTSWTLSCLATQAPDSHPPSRLCTPYRGTSDIQKTLVRLDLSGLVSFYDMELVPSLVSARDGQAKWDHRLLTISTEDAVRMRARLEEALSRRAGSSSGIDWQVQFASSTDILNVSKSCSVSSTPQTRTDQSQRRPTFKCRKCKGKSVGCAGLGPPRVQAVCYDTY